MLLIVVKSIISAVLLISTTTTLAQPPSIPRPSLYTAAASGPYLGSLRAGFGYGLPGGGFPLAASPYAGGAPFRPVAPVHCPPVPLRPSDSDHCKWTALHDLRGCLIRYKCEPLEPPPKPCPSAPRRPELGDTCNWIPIQDKRGCIIDYECEPLTPAPCPAPPEKPDPSPVCKWIPIKDKKGCVASFSCEPISFLPGFLPRRPFAPFHPALFRAGGAHLGARYNYPLAAIPRRVPHPFGLARGAIPARTGPIPFPFPGAIRRGNPLAAIAGGVRPVGPPGDNHPLCCFWASVGQCPVNPVYMLNDCRNACTSPLCIRSNKK